MFMWTFYSSDALPAGQTPATWLNRVLPRPRETFVHHFNRAQKLLAENAFDPGASVFAADERGPAGLTIVSGAGEKRQIDLVAARGDRRRKGLGRKLIKRTIDLLRTRSVQTLLAPGVSSANAAAAGLFESAGFTTNPTGGIRMRRSLDTPLPAYTEPEGIEIRAIRPGEEAAWVELKNACFVGEGGRQWTVDDFHREFTQAACFDPSRIFVALENGHMVATATAWEANYGEGPVGLIHWVGTRPECRGKGVGYAINVRALEELAALGYADAWLNTARWRAPAVRLYERQGFLIHREAVNHTLSL